MVAMRPLPLPLTLLALMTLACARPEPPPVEQLAAGSDAAARRVVISFYTAYVAGDIDSAVTHLCEDGAAELARAREFIGRSQRAESPFRIDRFEVGRAVPLWADRDPYYEVNVSFPRGEAEDALGHKHRVRARDGCIERFLPESGTPTAPAPPPADEPVLEAPVSAGDEVVEL
jgi:hypothetical protein